MAEFKRIPTDEDDAENASFEQHEPFLPYERQESKPKATKWYLAAKISTSFNILLALFLGWNIFQLKHNYNCVPGPQPPWSPVREDGFVQNINSAYKPQKIFQSETSDEVEAAWEGWLEEHDHLLVLPTERTEGRLGITVNAYLDPGHSVYGLAVHHQMHCLNHIRKTFYADRFFKNHSIEMIHFHKNHCFDMLRQTILCHADIAMVHWWNASYSYVDEAGHHQLTQHFHDLTPSMRAEGSFAKWDAKVQCRDLDRVHEWVKKYAMDDAKYIADVGIPNKAVDAT